ncbi:hypothetical protein EST38_g3859 [Candolleomyces aberdarensis]|uniref:DNA 3'-5' helicase n=1 Tax=Candolleomyces aberdarensis TaxID=2316362 RepID=A0A4Q2DPC1_9AGAR|nr:hypothetical protein EST38_g3859 [Candolleomyces aberdarensis]
MESMQTLPEPLSDVSELTISHIIALDAIEEVRKLYDVFIPSEKAIKNEFWKEYSEKEELCGKKASLALFVASGDRRIVPREFQLKATIALCSGKDALIDVGTGYGKTFCMVLPTLLSPGNISLVVSPLKKLQEMQVLEFRACGISALAINEDTPNDENLWQDIISGHYSVLVVQAEQFFVDKGHFPRLARLLYQRKFIKQIRFLLIDEAHCLYTMGTSLYGLPAFRPAWNYLAELRTRLGSNVTVAALSGTLPKHIKHVVKQRLQLDDDNLCNIKLSCNRPNISYAIHEIVGELSDYRNLDFLLSNETGSRAEGRRRRKGIVFHDSVEGAIAAKNFQDLQLPIERRGKGIIRHYNSYMSEEYLQVVYDDFRDPNGVCEILHATEAASTGLDVRDVYWVVQYGISREMTITQQRGGRCGRDGVTPSIHLIMFEPWAKTIDLTAALKEQENSNEILDPDRPICGKLPVKAKKRERTGVSMLRLVQHPEICIRKTFTRSNDDESDDGQLLYQDSCTNIKYRGTPTDPHRKALEGEAQGEKRSTSVATPNYRRVPWRASLASRLARWRFDTWKQDPLKAVRPQYLLLSDKAIDMLVRIHPNEVVNFEQVTLAIGESKDWEKKWAKQIFDVIRLFDVEVGVLEEKEQLEEVERKKRRKLEKEREEIEGNRRAFRMETEERHRQTHASSSSREEIMQRLEQLSAEAAARSTFQFQPVNKRKKLADVFEADAVHRQKEAERRAHEFIAQRQGAK